MKFKKIILPICIALVVLLSLGGVVAYIAIKTGTLVNTFDAGKIEVSVSTVEGANGEITFSAASTNNSDTDAYVRFKVVATWVSKTDESRLYAGAPVLDTDYSLTLAGGVIKIGDFYYVVSPVSKDSTIQIVTAELLEEADVPDGYQLRIEVLTDAIQSKPADAITDAWGVGLDGNGNITG